MASPSRSGSVARKIWRESFAASRRSSSVFSLPAMVTYSGLNPCSMSTPSFFCGRSRTCPTVALTRYPRPRYLPIVFALAGDSTMTSDVVPGWGGGPASMGGTARERRLGADRAVLATGVLAGGVLRAAVVSITAAPAAALSAGAFTAVAFNARFAAVTVLAAAVLAVVVLGPDLVVAIASSARPSGQGP